MQGIFERADLRSRQLWFPGFPARPLFNSAYHISSRSKCQRSRDGAGSKAMGQPRIVQTGSRGGLLADEPDFSIVLGGPLYQLYIRTRLARPPLELLIRRVL